MLQCCNCEFGKEMPNGNIEMTCNPARNVKEEACLLKWQLLKLASVERMQAHLMPLQAKLLQHNCSQIDDLQKGESWKHSGGGDEDERA